MKKNIKATVEIEAGSDFQYTFALQALNSMLETFKSILESTHKNNKVNINYGTKSISPKVSTRNKKAK